MIAKLKMYTECVEQTSQLPDSEDKTKFKNILVNQVKTLLKRLCDLQEIENFLMFNTLD